MNRAESAEYQQFINARALQFAVRRGFLTQVQADELIHAAMIEYDSMCKGNKAISDKLLQQNGHAHIWVNGACSWCGLRLNNAL